MLFAEVFVTILVIMDPVGNVPVFRSLTRDDDLRTRRRAALQATMAAACIILGFAAFGDQLLSLLDISLEALQVSAACSSCSSPSSCSAPAGRAGGRRSRTQR